MHWRTHRCRGITQIPCSQAHCLHLYQKTCTVRVTIDCVLTDNEIAWPGNSFRWRRIVHQRYACAERSAVLLFKSLSSDVICFCPITHVSVSYRTEPRALVLVRERVMLFQCSVWLARSRWKHLTVYTTQTFSYLKLVTSIASVRKQNTGVPWNSR